MIAFIGACAGDPCYHGAMPTRRRLSEAERALMRELHAAGNKFEYIASVTGRSTSVVHRAIHGYRGGWRIRPGNSL